MEKKNTKPTEIWRVLEIGEAVYLFPFPFSLFWWRSLAALTYNTERKWRNTRPRYIRMYCIYCNLCAVNLNHDNTLKTLCAHTAHCTSTFRKKKDLTVSDLTTYRCFHINQWADWIPWDSFSIISMLLRYFKRTSSLELSYQHCACRHLEEVKRQWFSKDQKSV